MKKRIQSFNSWKNTRTNENVSIDADSMRAWMMLETYHWSPLKTSGNRTLGDLFMLGKKSTLIDTLILKETAINENVRMITEDAELLEVFKMQIAYDFLNEEERGWGNKLARAVFGDKIVDRVEKAWDDFTGAVNDVVQKIVDKGTNLWDKTVSGVKSLVKNIGSVAKKIGEAIRSFLTYVWEGITKNAGKVGKILLGESGSKIKEMGNVLQGEKNESESKEYDELHKAAKKSSFSGESKQLGKDFGELRQKLFGGEEAPGGASTVAKIEDTAKKLEEVVESVDIQLSMDHIIFESLKGLCTIATDEDMEKLKAYESFDFASDIKLFESGDHKEKSAVVGWLSEIAKWVLSPVGNLIEFVTGQGVKICSSLPSAIARGWKNKSQFIIYPVAGALIAGLAYKITKIKSHFEEGGHHEGPAKIATSDVIRAGAIGGATMVGAVGMAASSGMDEESAQKVGQLMVGGMVGALMTIILALFPTVAFIFKLVMTALLIGMIAGFLADAFPKTIGSWMPEFFTKFYHAMH